MTGMRNVWIGFAFLLGLGGVFSPSVVHAQGCPLPPEFIHSVSFDDAGLVTTLATTKSAYAMGDSIPFWLSFENTGATVRTIPNPAMISPLQSIRLVPTTCDSSTADGCPEASLFWYPGFHYYFGTPIVLDPGECSSMATTWDGVPSFGGTTNPGYYSALGGAENGFAIFYPGHGIRLEIRINPWGTPVLPATWGRLKSRAP